MWWVAFRATLFSSMFSHIHLREFCRASRFPGMAAHTETRVLQGDRGHRGGIRGMCRGGAMASLAGESLVAGACKFLNLIIMAFSTGFAARKRDRFFGILADGIAPIPAVLTEGCRHQEMTGDEKGHHHYKCQQENPRDLGGDWVFHKVRGT